MLVDDDLCGAGFCDKSLALTFDDGPGPKTEEIGRFLHEEAASATFFMIGRPAAEQPELLRRLEAWGHRIGNHTWSHAGLVDLALGGGDIVAEVSRADEIIRPFAPPDSSASTLWQLAAKIAPDGPQDFPSSIVASALRASGRFDDYLGPVIWDIIGEDWKYWEEHRSVDECLERQLNEIRRARRGIVLFHDSAHDARQAHANRTAEVILRLVPILKRDGYQFLPLDESKLARKSFAAQPAAL